MARKPVPVTDLGNTGASIDTDRSPAPVIVSDSSDANSSGNPEPEVINGFESFNPADDSGNFDSGTRKRRGRPAGSTNKGERASKKGNLGGLEQILLSLHMMAGAFFQAPELALAPDEAKAMADAAATVAGLYHHTLDPRMMAWVNLAMVCGGIYGTRIIVIRARLKSEVKPQAKVIPIAAAKQAAAAAAATSPR